MAGARRGRQFSGSPDSPDVIGWPNVHIECKRTKGINIYNALDQAMTDAEDKVPVVFHRRDRREWVVCVRSADLLALCEAVGGCSDGGGS